VQPFKWKLDNELMIARKVQSVFVSFLKTNIKLKKKKKKQFLIFISYHNHNTSKKIKNKNTPKKYINKWKLKS
jgi:hypothetical protein